MQPTLTVNLAAIAENYRTLKQQFSGESVGAVVKANAYGLGAVPVSLALMEQGCKQLFVATLEEGVALKQELAEALQPDELPAIAVFHGPYRGQEEAFIEHNLNPVINHINQLERWMLKSEPDSSASYMLHVDTGMTRLGLSASDVTWLFNHGEHLLKRGPSYLMSHLACANQKEDPKNKEQLQRFAEMQQCFKGVPTSFCNSAGVYLDRIFHGELARPGSALYGIRPTQWMDKNPMRHVADLTAPILMVRHLDRHETIGYGATAEIEEGGRVAIVQMGYADGYLRYLSNKGAVYVGGVRCPVVGRVSMDMIAVDVSYLSDQALAQHKTVSIICEQQPVDMVADQAETIGYEVFTNLADRVVRTYTH